MQDSKLILLLKTFTKEDWRWFRKFLLSPYFNNRAELIVLFDYLRVLSPDFKETGLKKEKVFKKIFPDQSFKEKELSYTMSYLLTQAEQFLTQRRIETSTPRMNNYLLDALVDRNLDKHYNFHYQKFSNQLDHYKSTHTDFYLLKYQLNEIANIHFDNQNLRRNDYQLQSTYDSLNQFYFLNILKHSCELLTRQKVYGGHYKFSFTELIVDYLNQQEEIAPLILIYLQIYSFLKEEHTESDFDKLKTLFQKFQSSIPTEEKRLITLRVLNHCAFQINQNRNTEYFTKQSLDFYINGIEEGFLLTKGFLSPWTFKNVVRHGLNIKKYDFTDDFIQTYHKKLETEFQNDALHYNLADLHYRKKEYPTAQTHLIQVQFSDIFYTLGAKVMLLKIYYETDEIEALFALVASFSIYIRRNKKISDEFRAAFMSFNSLLSQIIRATKDKIPPIIEKINDTKQLTDRRWLLEICTKK